MMTEKQLIEKFLELQEHAGQLTDEQLQRALNDEQMQELAEQMAFTKRALINEELRENPLPARRFPLLKLAAAFVGLLMLSGIAIAAIHIVHSVGGDMKSPVQEMQTSDPHRGALPADTITTDTMAMEQRVFNDVPLSTILTCIAAAHHVGVEFQNEEACELRFHFVWKRDDSLHRVVEKLNTFDAVNIVVENEKLIVR